MLKARRYAGAAAHLGRAFDAARAQPQDELGAAREAVHALEAMLKLVTAKRSGTFADAAKVLVKEGRLHARLGDALKMVWAYSNQKAGVRHGSATPPNMDVLEATFVMNLCAAAMLYLLGIDNAK